MTNIDFRDSLLKLRDKVGHAEHYWKQGNDEKAKEHLQELSQLSEEVADYHFNDVETINDVENALELIQQKGDEE